MALRGACTGGGDGATNTSNTRVLTLPAGCQPGDVCVVETTININGSTATIPGFAVKSGPDSALSGHVNWLLTKTLTSADISAGSFTVTWSSSGRTLAVGTVRSGITGIEQAAYNGTGSTTSITAPTVVTSEAGADVFTLAFSRIGSGQPVSASYPAGWTQGVQTATSMASGVNWGGSTATKDVVGAAGTYGGEVISFAGTATSASAYTIAGTPVPAAVDLTVHGARAATRAGKATLTQASPLTIHAARAATRADRPLLTQASPLVAHGARAETRTAAVTIEQTSPLTIHGARAEATATSPLLEVPPPGELTIHDVRAESRADRPLLEQVTPLAVTGARADALAASPLLTQTSDLAVHDARAETTATSPVLAGGLLVHDARADTRADTALLTQLAVLACHDARAPTRAGRVRLTLTAGLPPAERTLTIAPDDRTLTIPAEVRTLVIPRDDRTLTIA